MWERSQDTIAAVASPWGPGARLIIRISGPEAWQAVMKVIDTGAIMPIAEPSQPVIVSAQLSGELFGAPIPCEIYYWPAGRSYTGQSVVELHTLNCRPLAEALLRELGVRLAKPGEFTLRAFVNGRLDLTQAEAVLGVVEAQNERDLHVALQQLAGGVAKPLRSLRDELLNLLADVEAGLDFPEEDLPFLSREGLLERLKHLGHQLDEIRRQFVVRRSTTELPRVVLVGPPNAGKSTLFNALVSSERAIVSPQPGTTRDYLTAVCTHRGFTFELVDTAGFGDFNGPTVIASAETVDVLTNSEESRETIDEHANSAARRAMSSADLLLLCWESTRWPVFPSIPGNAPPWILVLTKGDLLTDVTDLTLPAEALLVSAHTGLGLADLKEKMISRLTLLEQTAAGVVGVTALRCGAALQRAREALNQAEVLTLNGESEEFIAASLHAALDEIGSVTGEVHVEEILDRVFSRFCIGK